MKRCLACDQSFEAIGWQCPFCGVTPAQQSGILLFAPEIAARKESYDPAWYPDLARLEDANFWFRARNRLIRWLARRHLPPAGAFLEIGCGTGFVLKMLRDELRRGWTLTGSETHCEGLRFAMQRVGAGVEFQQIDANALPYRGEFDAIGAFDVLEHIRDDGDALRQIHAALKHDGVLIASVPQHQSLWGRYDEIGGHYRRYGAVELVGLLERQGFRMVETTSFNSLLLPLLWLSRKLRRIREATVLDELRIGVIANAVLAGVLAVEFALITLGVRWPAGGSRVFVARKNVT